MEGISVILTTFNGATRGFLNQAIESVLNQTYPNIELIIVDDGSIDETEQLCFNYLDDKIKYFKKPNGGPASARNLGLSHSQYDFISFLDDDDLFENRMVEKLLFFFKEQNDPLLGMVYCSVQEIESEKVCFEMHEGNIFNSLLKGNFLSTSALIIHKKVFDAVGYFSEELRYSEDYDLWLRISEKFHVAGLNDLLVKRRVHANQLSTRSEKMQVYHRFILEKACDLPMCSLKKDEVLFSFYKTYARIFLGQRKYNLFRKECRAAKDFGKIPIKLKIKYFLSYSPRIFNFIHRFVKKFE